MKYGYARISKPTQNIDRQIRNIKAFDKDALIVADKYTGTKLDRPAFTKLMNIVKAGDTIIFDSVSRMSRNAVDGFAVYEKLFNDDVELIFLKEPHINTSTYKDVLNNTVKLTGTSLDYILDGINKYLMELAKEQIRLSFEQAEKEVLDLHQRTKEGIETARLNGKQIGQKQGSKLNVKKAVESKKKILKYSQCFNGSLSDADCISLLGISRNTFYKYKKELKENEQTDNI